MRKLLIVLALGLLAGITTVVAVADRSDVSVGDRDKHLLLDMVQETDGSFRVLRSTVVSSGLPKQRGLGQVRPWRFALIADGLVLHEAGLEDPAVIRGEFQDPEDPSRIQAVRVRQQGPVQFSIRVPLLRREALLEFHALRPEMQRAPLVTPEAYRTLGRVAFTPVGGE